MKKYLIFLILLVFLFIFTACNTIIDKPKADIDESINNNENNKENNKENNSEQRNPEKEAFFSSISEFEAYIYNPTEQKEEVKIAPEDYIDLSSIMPDTEWHVIYLAGNTTHMFKSEYELETQNFINFKINHIYPEQTLTEINELYGRPTKSEYVYRGLTEMESIGEMGHYRFNIGDTEIIYGINPDSDKPVNFFSVIIEDFYINIIGFRYSDPETDAQSELYKALVPQYGATDDSVIEMLDKIKALIPKS